MFILAKNNIIANFLEKKRTPLRTRFSAGSPTRTGRDGSERRLVGGFPAALDEFDDSFIWRWMKEKSIIPTTAGPLLTRAPFSDPRGFDARSASRSGNNLVNPVNVFAAATAVRHFHRLTPLSFLGGNLKDSKCSHLEPPSRCMRYL